MSGKGSAVLYKDSNGEKYGVIEKVDNEKNRYLISPFGSDSKLWISKEDAIHVEPEVGPHIFINGPLQKDINSGFIKLSLDLAINQPEEIEKDLLEAATVHFFEDPLWEEGQVCVCRWCCDDEWYFGVITAISHEDRTVDVRFLYYENSQTFIPIDQIHPVNSTTIEWIKDDYNADAAFRILGVNWPAKQPLEEEFKDVAGQTSPTPEEEKEAKPKKNKKQRENLRHFSKGYGPEGRLNIPEISRSWLNLVGKTYGSETSAIRRLILSQYQLGYDAGFRMGLKTRGAAQE